MGIRDLSRVSEAYAGGSPIHEGRKHMWVVMHGATLGLFEAYPGGTGYKAQLNRPIQGLLRPIQRGRRPKWGRSMGIRGLFRESEACVWGSGGTFVRIPRLSREV